MKIRRIGFWAIVLFTTATRAHDGPHPDDPVKRAEHLAAINLVNHDTAVHVAGKSSDYTFAPTDDLYVEAGTEFVIDGDLDVRRILFDGTLRVAAKALTIKVETLVGNTVGHISIPPSSALRTLRIKARGPRDREGDPTDISGGIVLHSKDNVLAGEPKTRWAAPSVLDRTADRIEFSQPVLNWKVGDRLVVPGVTWEQPDEILTITAVVPGGKAFLTTDLVQDHSLPDGSLPEVGNATCSLVIESEDPALSQRGHVMIMHEHTGTSISNTAFRQLGRTTVELPPTKITLGPDGEFISGDANTIGRYPIHFHGRSGASVTEVPHQFIDNVVEDSPRHGIVNHGSNVSARGNLVFNFAGSGVFGENGLELGDFTSNLIVGARGPVAVLDPATEAATFNFGFEGYSVWLQGPGMKVVGNRMYRAKFALIGADMTMLPDGGGQFDYPVAYIPDGPHKSAILAGTFGTSKVRVGLHQVPMYFADNKGAGSQKGINITHLQYDTRSPGDGTIHTKIYAERTQIIGLRVFNVDAGADGTYQGHIDYRNCRFDGNLKLANYWRPYHGTAAGTKVHDISYFDCEFNRFQVGVLDRGWSDWLVERCRFRDNLIDIQIMAKSMNLNTHVFTIRNCTHFGKPAMEAMYATRPANQTWGRPSRYWIIDQFPQKSSTYAYETFMISPHSIDGRVLLYPHSLDSFIPFLGIPTTKPEKIYNGLTNKQLWDTYGKAVTGQRFDPADPTIESLGLDANIPVYAKKLTP